MFEKLTRFETNDKSTPPTAYYRNTYEQVKAAIYVAAKAIDFDVKSHNNDHMEFLLKNKKGVEIIVTAFKITIMETAIDLVVMTPVLRSGKKIAEEFLAEMKKHTQPK